MIDPGLEARCEAIRTTLECTRIPIDPIAMAEKEEIILSPGNYGNDFDGRIEFLLPERRFAIFYQDDYTNVAEVRVRFSLGHELGHYFLPAHRAALCGGSFHDSQQALMSDDQREHEADSFSASLLIPRKELDRRLGSRGFMEMQQIVRMAEDLQVSVPAAALRYFGYAEEKCAVILSRDGVIKCHLPSDSMRDIGLSYMKPGSTIPPSSAAKALLDSGASRQFQGADSSTEVWYPSRRYNTLPLYEDSFSLGYDNRVITLLSVWKS